MLLYLCSNDNINLIDFLNEEHGIIIKKLSGAFSLKQFVISDLRSLEHFNFVFIDLTALKDTEKDIMEALNAFRRMFSSRVIFYIEELKEHEKLVLELIEDGFYNIITSTEVSMLKEEILKSISDLGISKREIQSKLAGNELINSSIYTENSFIKKEIKIAVTGVTSRVGTTTMAINMANYLSNIGAKACYVEANENNHLRKLPEFYPGMTIKEDVILYNGVKYLSLHSECHDEFDFIIYDMGVVSNKIIGAIRNNCDAAVICLTGKPYETNDLENLEKLLDEKHISKIGSLVAESDKRKIEKQVGNVQFSNYTPDYFDGDVNESIWNAVIEPFIRKEGKI